ncbi:helix-turn-helix domain-containing protein [Micromonospora sp. M12]
MTNPTTGDNLARLRRAAKLTQEQLAERATLSVETVRKLEQNKPGSARLDTLHAFARALGVPTTALIGDASEAAARTSQATGRCPWPRSAGQSPRARADRCGAGRAHRRSTTGGHAPGQTARRRSRLPGQ